jgi:excisionase family DNA binding protein
MTKEPKVSELITMREAAQYCGRSHPRMNRYAQSGKLRAWKVGMQWLTTKKEVDRLFKSRHERWLDTFHKMTKFAKIRAHYRCENCGRPENTNVALHVLKAYHLDGDDTNWEPENLAAVCRLCDRYLQEHCHQLPLPGIEHPLHRLRQLRAYPKTSGPGSHARRSDDREPIPKLAGRAPMPGDPTIESLSQNKQVGLPCPAIRRSRAYPKTSRPGSHARRSDER